MKLSIHDCHARIIACSHCDHGRVDRGTEVCTRTSTAIRFFDKSETCPLGKWSAGETQAASAARPGQLLKLAIAKITGEQPSECGCNKRAKQMDDNGWWWCWRNRRTIAGWLVESARARPAKIRKQAQQLREQADALDTNADDAEQVAQSLDADRATTLLVAAWKELIRQNTNAKQKPPTERDHG